MESLASSPSTSANLKNNKSINNSNGGAANFSRHPESNLLVDYVSPTKKASDNISHSITQIISGPIANHSSSHVSSHKHQTQPSMAQSTYSIDNPTTSAHSIPNKSGQSGGSKQKSDVHHRSQSSTNSSNNNNFINNNNNNNSKHTTPRHMNSASTCIVLSDTDDGETTPKKAKQHKHKHNKKSRETVSNNVPLPNPVHLMNHHISQQASAMGVNSATSDDPVDHDQIIHDLKVNRSFLRKYFDLQL